MYKKTLLLTILAGLMLTGCKSFDCCMPSTISVTPPVIELTNVGDSDAFTVICPISWTITGMIPACTWLDVNKTTGEVTITEPNDGADVREVKLTFMAANGDKATATVKQNVYDPATDPSITDDGVEINGVIWATRNVGAFGKFAATPESTGMLYQWNRATAYSATDPLEPAWDTSPISPTWDTANDPCPTGWHVPDAFEMAKLFNDAANVDYAWEVTGGRFTDKATPTNSIFLPATDWRDTDGTLMDGSTTVNYWTTWTDGSTLAGLLTFLDGGAVSTNGFYLQAFPIRCVKD